MYSGLAHVLLHRSTLKDDIPDEMPQRLSRQRSTISNKSNDAFLKFKATYLEIEYGLLLQAMARHWIRENKKLHSQSLAPRQKDSFSKSKISFIDIALEEKKLKKHINSNIMIGESWLHERPSLAIDSSQDDNVIGGASGSSFDQVQLNKMLEEVEKKTPRSRYYHPKRSSCFNLGCGKGHFANTYLPISPRIIEVSQVKKKPRSSSLKHVM